MFIRILVLKVARYSFLKKMEIYDLDPYFWKIITCLKIKVLLLCKKTSKEFEFIHKSCTTAVDMATMTFQNGGYFGFKVIYLEKDIGDPLFLFQKMFLLGILNYFFNFKRNL